MNFLFELLKVVLLIMFPLVLWKSMEGVIANKNNYFYLALLISFIFSLFSISSVFLLFYNCYLLIFLLNDKKIYFIFSCLYILIFYFSLFLVIEFILLFILFYVKKNKLSFFLFLSIYFYSLISFVDRVAFINIVFTIILFYLVSIYICKVLLKDIYFEIQSRYNGYLFNFIHEVKNPLSVVLGYLEIIKKKEDCDINKYLVIIDKEVNESLTIIEDYLMYGRFNVNFDYLDINLLLKEVYSDFKKLENLYDLVLNFYYDEEEVIVFGDYSKLKQVFVNIIKNGIEAHGDKKLIIDIDYKIVKDNIIIDINDNGKGIVDTSMIGKEYYTSKLSGNGIGAVFSKKILNIHNGDIRYISNGINGCDVRINLPIVNI